MSSLAIILSILKTFGTSLGVGASTLTIVNYFVAIADGYIDENERRMLGIGYTLLRVAMAAILIGTLGQLLLTYSTSGLSVLPTFLLAQILVLFVLFLNALLMSAHVVPNTVGPALQAGSWYTLGFMFSIEILELTDFTILQFILGYITWLILAIAIVNSILAILKAKRVV